MIIAKFIVMLVSLSFLAFQGPQAGGDDDLKLLLDKTLPTQSGLKLTVDAFAGNVKITNSSTNEVAVRIYGNSNAEENLGFDVSSDASGVKVDASKKSGFKTLKNLSLKFEISVPLDYNVKITTGGGSVSLTSLKGNVEISSMGGNVSLGNITGDIDISTAGGNISVDQNAGKLKVSTAGGNIKAEKFDGNVDASTAGGNIHLSGSNGKVDGSTAGGNIHLDYTGKNNGIDLSTMAGQISLNLPSDFDANADLSTMTGRINCDFYNAEGVKKYSNLQTKFNNGGEVLKCSTMAGDIKVSKKSN